MNIPDNLSNANLHVSFPYGVKTWGAYRITQYSSASRTVIIAAAHIAATQTNTPQRLILIY